MEEIREWKEHDEVKGINDKEVRCYTEHGMGIKCYSRYGRDENGTFRYEKTYVIDAGYMDGEKIDLFDLQEWFDENREWINGLKSNLKQSP